MATLELHDVAKSFGSTQVLRGVSLSLRGGEVHVLAGANGAGKSTLIKILGGAIADFSGRIEIDGKTSRFRDPMEARAAGVSIIHQELSLVPAMSVVDNVFLGRESFFLGRRREEREAAHAALAQLGLDVDVDAPIESLPVSQQQLVEIAKALSAAREGGARVLVMDEPTSALDESEASSLFDRVRELRARGCAILFVTHRMEEIYALADRITVLRDGVVAASAPVADLDRDALLAAMLGKELLAVAHDAHDAPEKQGEIVLRVHALSVEREVRGVSMSVGRGEIVGVAGVAGSGASALLHAIFGSHPRRARGSVLVEEKELPLGDPVASVARGVVLVPSDRKALGLVMPRSVLENASLTALARWSRAGWVRTHAERDDVAAMIEALRVVAPSLDAPVDALSGGNQQKVVLARCLLAAPRVLLLDEPTRGVDVGAKAEIHRKIRQIARDGAAVVVATTELEDLFALCDRVLVLHRGALVVELSRREATRARVLAAAMGQAHA